MLVHVICSSNQCDGWRSDAEEGVKRHSTNVREEAFFCLRECKRIHHTVYLSKRLPNSPLVVVGGRVFSPRVWRGQTSGAGDESLDTINIVNHSLDPIRAAPEELHLDMTPLRSVLFAEQHMTGQTCCAGALHVVRRQRRARNFTALVWISVAAGPTRFFLPVLKQN